MSERKQKSLLLFSVTSALVDNERTTFYSTYRKCTR